MVFYVRRPERGGVGEAPVTRRQVLRQQRRPRPRRRHRPPVPIGPPGRTGPGPWESQGVWAGGILEGSKCAACNVNRRAVTGCEREGGACAAACAAGRRAASVPRCGTLAVQSALLQRAHNAVAGCSRIPAPMRSSKCRRSPSVGPGVGRRSGGARESARAAGAGGGRGPGGAEGEADAGGGEDLGRVAQRQGRAHGVVGRAVRQQVHLRPARLRGYGRGVAGRRRAIPLL
jgi:hypothetical protein